jgi:hypothetical protein
MSIAYQALVIFLFLLPGLLYRRAASTAGKFRKQRSLADELALGMLAALVAHFIGIGLFTGIGHLCGVRIALDSAMMHAMGDFGPDSEELRPAIRAVTDYPVYVLVYFIAVCGGSAAAGVLVKWCRDKKWKHAAFLDWFENEPAAERFRQWSRALGSPDESKLSTALLATVIELGGAAYLYVGFLKEVRWSEDGEPEFFVLADEVIRRPFNEESDRLEGDRGANRFYEVVGTSFTIRASEAKTINVLVRYLEMPEGGERVRG